MEVGTNKPKTPNLIFQLDQLLHQYKKLYNYCGNVKVR
jgi:hypothetical protein